MKAKFLHADWSTYKPPVTVEWTQEIDDGTWSKFVDFMKGEGYFIPKQKPSPQQLDAAFDQIQDALEVIRGNRQA